jgi:hypothetical protein
MSTIFKPITKEEFKERQKEVFIKYLLSQDCYETNKGWNSDSDLNISNMNLTEIPVKFYKINGNFSCSYNNLTSLKFRPEIVNGNFYCSFNKLTSLEFCPKEVKGFFYCYNNPLKSKKHNCKILGKIYF